MNVLVRLSSLGDVVLASAFTQALAPVCFVTLPRYHDLVRRFVGVVEVRGPDDPLPAGPIYDLQNKLRTRRFPAVRRLARFDLARRSRVWFKTAPAPPVLQRYGAVVGQSPAALPWLPPVRRGDALILVPGAAHATKRWPYFQALATQWGGPVRAIGGPGEEAEVSALGGTAERGFDATMEAMNGGAVICGGDTGLLHLGAALGLPAVGIFGPTTSMDGFFSYGGTAVELPLACRPCSRFGGATCPMGDHACMRTLPVETVLAACRAAALPAQNRHFR